MSTKKTRNYQLHQWEPGDDFLRTEFNENFTKLDAAVHGLVVTGSYTGDKAASRNINLGFTPRLVFVITKDGLIINGTYTYGGVALKGQAGSAVTIVEGGFSVQRNNFGNYVICSNESGYLYFYWALR